MISFIAPFTSIVLALTVGWVKDTFWTDRVIETVIHVSVVVTAYHLLPIPPLFGSRLLYLLVPLNHERVWRVFSKAGQPSGTTWQISPGNAPSPSHLCPPHIRPYSPCRYRTLNVFAFSSSMNASYVISVRQASALPTASFRSHLTVGTLAVQLTVPPAGPVGDFHPQVTTPCRPH